MLVKNLTPFFHGTKVGSRKPPSPEMTFVVRGTFRLVADGVVEVVEGLDQGFLSGELYAESELGLGGECIYPGDFADFKLAAEVMLRGSCHVPGGRPAPSCPVQLRVGKWKKTLAVFGHRRWQHGLTGATVGAAEPFTVMPLDWAHAFGGPGYRHNPAGKGHGSDELPNVELASGLIRARSDEPPPGGFGPINPAWPARASRRGTSWGADYARERAPFYAEDFHYGFFSAAPADQQLGGYLAGDEELELVNLHPRHAVLTTRLPALRLRLFVKDDRAEVREVPVVLDTIFLEPDADLVRLTWRGVSRVRERDLVDVRTVLVASEPLGEPPRPVQDYLAELEAFERDPTGVLGELPPELRAAWERAERQRRGEPALERPADPSHDPVTAAIAAGLGPLAGEELLQEVGSRMKQLANAPGFDAEAVAAAVAKAVAANDDAAPPMRTLKPGSFPDLGIRRAMRQVMAETERARELERQAGAKASRLAELEALPHDPRWRKLEPDYQPPGPLSTDAPGPGADLRERDLRGLDLRCVDLRGANLERADLSRATLRGALLVGANLRKAILFRADLTDANLRGADLTLAHAAAIRAEGADFTDAVLSECFLEGARLARATLDRARADYAIFERADLRGASARGAHFDHADLSEAMLSGARLAGASAELALFLSCSLEGADLTDAKLSRASLKEANLQKAKLTGAVLSRAYLERARLDGADLSWADLRGAHLPECSAVAGRFYGANLADARLYRADLSFASFERANLMAADLCLATLQQTRFARASLYDAKLRGIRGDGYDLRGSNLKRALLEGA